MITEQTEEEEEKTILLSACKSLPVKMIIEQHAPLYKSLREK